MLRVDESQVFARCERNVYDINYIFKKGNIIVYCFYFL